MRHRMRLTIIKWSKYILYCNKNYVFVSQNTSLYYSCLVIWHDKLHTWQDEVRRVTRTLWHSVGLLLTCWGYIRRRTVCFQPRLTRVTGTVESKTADKGRGRPYANMHTCLHMWTCVCVCVRTITCPHRCMSTHIHILDTGSFSFSGDKFITAENGRCGTVKA